MDGFLNLMLGSLDSRPILAAVGGFKKECTCGTPEKCTCKPRFSDKDATIGRQRIKVNVQLPYIVADMAYIGGEDKIAAMKDYGTCPKEFIYSFQKEPQFFGPIGQGSELHEKMFCFRNQTELNFALDANLLDNVLHHKKLRIRGIKQAEIFLKLSDIFRLMIGMLHRSEKFFVPKGRSALLMRFAEQAIYDRVLPEVRAVA